MNSLTRIGVTLLSLVNTSTFTVHVPACACCNCAENTTPVISPGFHTKIRLWATVHQHQIAHGQCHGRRLFIHPIVERYRTRDVTHRHLYQVCPVVPRKVRVFENSFCLRSIHPNALTPEHAPCPERPDANHTPHEPQATSPPPPPATTNHPDTHTTYHPPTTPHYPPTHCHEPSTTHSANDPRPHTLHPTKTTPTIHQHHRLHMRTYPTYL